MSKKTKTYSPDSRIGIAFPAEVHEQIRFAAGAVGQSIQQYAVDAAIKRLASDKNRIMERANKFASA